MSWVLCTNLPGFPVTSHCLKPARTVSTIGLERRYSSSQNISLILSVSKILTPVLVACKNFQDLYRCNLRTSRILLEQKHLTRTGSVLGTFWLLRNNIRHLQLKGEKVYFGLQFLEVSIHSLQTPRQGCTAEEPARRKAPS